MGVADGHEEIYVGTLRTPIGELLLSATGRGLCGIEFGAAAEDEERLLRWASKRIGGDARLVRGGGAAPSPHPLIGAAQEQLRDYFAGRRQSFELPLDLRGTAFQLRVWRALTQVPYGETQSYKGIAEAIGAPKAVRAVGGANNRNPVPIVVPCHRIVGHNGALVGYGGGLDIKTYLLRLEGSRYSGQVH